MIDFIPLLSIALPVIVFFGAWVIVTRSRKGGSVRIDFDQYKGKELSGRFIRKGG